MKSFRSLTQQPVVIGSIAAVFSLVGVLVIANAFGDGSASESDVTVVVTAPPTTQPVVTVPEEEEPEGSECETTGDVITCEGSVIDDAIIDGHDDRPAEARPVSEPVTTVYTNPDTGEETVSEEVAVIEIITEEGDVVELPAEVDAQEPEPEPVDTFPAPVEKSPMQEAWDEIVENVSWPAPYDIPGFEYQNSDRRGFITVDLVEQAVVYQEHNYTITGGFSTDLEWCEAIRAALPGNHENRCQVQLAIEDMPDIGVSAGEEYFSMRRSTSWSSALPGEYSMQFRFSIEFETNSAYLVIEAAKLLGEQP